MLDPSSDNIDYQNPLKNYVEDPNATLSREDISAASNEETEQPDNIEQDEAVYDTKDRTTEQEAESGQSSKGNNSATTASKEKNSSSGKAKQSSKNNSAKKDDGGKGKNNDGKDADGTDGDKDSKADEPGKVYNGNGKLDKLPTNLKSVCAVGEDATIVLSIAGAEHLAGTSAEYLGSSAVKKLFGSDALSDVKSCWKNSGQSSTDINVDAVIKAKPDAVLVESEQDTVPAAAQKKLRDAGIAIVTLPSLVSDSYIKKAVRAVGHLFSESTDGASQKKAESYVDMVNDVLKSAKSAHGGSVSSYNNVDYDNVTDANPTNSAAGGATNWTVLITGWQKRATVTASFSGKALFKETGVATTEIGWKWSPVSYYMGCGGAVNNAAAYGSYSDAGTRLFLNYNENQVSYSWTGLGGSVSVGKDGGSFKQGNTYVLTNACDARESLEEHHLGSKDFNKVIVKTASIKKSLAAARENSKGLYTPGSYQTGTSVKGYGLNINGKLLRCYSVVSDSARDDTLYDIVVNPAGMLGSWVDGSMESFLEAAWTASEFCGYESAKLRENISSFYQEFYGYTLSDAELDKIVSGAYAEE